MKLNKKNLTQSSTLEIAAWLRRNGYEFCPEALEEVTRQLLASHDKLAIEMPMEKYLEGVEYTVNMCTTQ